MEEIIGRALNNRFLIHALIGKGVYSSVYLASDLRRKAEVAVKLVEIQPEQLSPILQSLKSDITRLKALNHPNIVRYYSVEAWGNQPLIVMDYIKENQIETYLSDYKEPMQRLGEVARLYYYLCSLFEYTHGMGINHAFLKPSNVHLKNHQFIVTDFLIPKTLRFYGYSLIGLDQQRYIAPELMVSNAYSNQCDIYSLGMILYDLLTANLEGSSDVKGESKTLDKWKLLKNLAFSGYPERISSQVCVILEKCLAPNPAERYPTVSALYQDLQRVIEGPEKSRFQPKTELARTVYFAESIKERQEEGLFKSYPHFKPSGAVVLLIILVVGLLALFQLRAIRNRSGSVPSGSTPPFSQINAGFPQIYTPLNLCQTITLDEQLNLSVEECIKGVHGADDQRFFLYLLLTAHAPAGYSIIIHSDQNNPSNYVLDDQENRYNILEVGGEFSMDKELENGGVKSGWYLFPPLSGTAKYIVFHDVDNQLVFPPINIPGR